MTLTQVDLNDIEKIVDEKIEEKTKNLPTKNDFFQAMDQVMGELKATREEIVILSDLKRQVNEHETKICQIVKNFKIKPSIG